MIFFSSFYSKLPDQQSLHGSDKRHSARLIGCLATRGLTSAGVTASARFSSKHCNVFGRVVLGRRSLSRVLLYVNTDQSTVLMLVTVIERDGSIPQRHVVVSVV